MQPERASGLKLMRVSEAAKVLDVSEARVYELIRTGVLASVRIGRQVRLDPARFREFIETGGCGL